MTTNNPNLNLATLNKNSDKDTIQLTKVIQATKKSLNEQTTNEQDPSQPMEIAETEMYTTKDNMELSLCFKDPISYFANQPVSELQYHSIVQFNMAQVNTSNNSWYKILDYDRNEEPRDLNCGRNALSKALKIELPRSLFMENNDKYVTCDVLLSHAREHNYNLLILHKNGTYMQQSKPDVQFVTLIHGSLSAEVDDDHFMPGNIKQVDLVHQFICRHFTASETLINKTIQQIDPNMSTESLDHDTMLLTDAVLSRLINNPLRTYVQLMPKVTTINKKSIFTNNEQKGVHDLYNGQIHVEIRDELKLIYNLFSLDSNKSHLDNSLIERLDVDEGDWRQLEKTLNAELSATIKQSLHTLNEFNKHGKVDHNKIKRHYVVSVYSEGANIIIDQYSDKWKSMDLVILNVNGRMVKAFMFPNRYMSNTLIVPQSLIPDGKYKMYELKMSFSSLIMRLSTAGKVDLPLTRLVSLIDKAKLVTGGPGSGKTEILCKTMTDNDLAIGMTSESVRTIKARLVRLNKKHLVKNVMSVERASNMRLILTGTLHVDEASQLSYSNLVSIVTQTTKAVTFYGDTTQIGRVDMMYDIPGHRTLINLTNMVSTDNTTTLTMCRRFGNPLALALQELRPDLTGDPTKVTNYQIINLRGLDAIIVEDLKELSRKYAISTTITALNDTVYWLTHNKVIHQDNKLSTVFSYQSSEDDRVMLVIKPNSNGSYGIGRHKSNIVSACSRATEFLLIVIINCEDEVKTIADIVQVQGAGTNYSRKQFELPIAVQQLEATKAAAKYPGTSVIVTKEAGGIQYNITGPMGLASGKMLYKDGKVTIDTQSGLLKSSILSSIDKESLQVIDYDRELEYINSNKLRWLAWVVDKQIGDYYGARFMWNLTTYTIKKTKGCPYAAALTVRKTNFMGCSTVVLHINKEKFGGARSGIINRDDEFAMLLATWLEIKYHDEPSIDMGLTPFDSIKVPYNTSQLMLWDRVRRFPTCMFSLMYHGCQYNKSCVTAKDLHNKRLQDITKTTGYEFKSNPEFVVSHKNLLIRKKGYILNTAYLSTNQGTIAYTDYPTLDSQISLWKELAEDLPTLLDDLIRGLEGLNMPIEKHKELKTAVYDEYVKKLSQVKRYTIGGMDNCIWVSAGRLEMTRLLMADVSENLHINTHHFNVETQLTELLDGYMILRDGSAGLGSRIAYLGMEPMLPSLYNKHYIELIYNNSCHAKAAIGKAKFENAISQIAGFIAGSLDDEALDPRQVASQQVKSTVHPECKTVLLGTVMMLMNMNDLATVWTSDDAVLYGWVPTASVDERLGKVVEHNGKMYLTQIGSNLEQPLNEMMYAISQGAVYPVPILDKYVKSEVIDYMLGFNYVKLQLVDIKPKITAELESSSVGDTLNVLIPWFNPNIKSILNSKQIFTTRTIKVKPYLFRSMCMRLLARSSTSLNDLLMYTRTVGSAYETSETNFRMKYSIDVSVLRSTAYAAWYYHNQQSKRYIAVKWLLDNVKNKPSAIVTNLMSIVRELLKTFEIISGAVSGLTDEINELIKSNTLELGLDLNVLGDCDASLRVMFDVEKARIIVHEDEIIEEATLEPPKQFHGLDDDEAAEMVAELHNLGLNYEVDEIKSLDNEWTAGDTSSKFYSILNKAEHSLVLLSANNRSAKMLALFRSLIYWKYRFNRHLKIELLGITKLTALPDYSNITREQLDKCTTNMKIKDPTDQYESWLEYNMKINTFNLLEVSDTPNDNVLVNLNLLPVEPDIVKIEPEPTNVVTIEDRVEEIEISTLPKLIIPPDANMHELAKVLVNFVFKLSMTTMPFYPGGGWQTEISNMTDHEATIFYTLLNTNSKSMITLLDELEKPSLRQLFIDIWTYLYKVPEDFVRIGKEVLSNPDFDLDYVISEPELEEIRRNSHLTDHGTMLIYYSTTKYYAEREALYVKDKPVNRTNTLTWSDQPTSIISQQLIEDEMFFDTVEEINNEEEITFNDKVNELNEQILVDWSLTIDDDKPLSEQRKPPTLFSQNAILEEDSDESEDSSTTTEESSIDSTPDQLPELVTDEPADSTPPKTESIDVYAELKQTATGNQDSQVIKRKTLLYRPDIKALLKGDTPVTHKNPMLITSLMDIITKWKVGTNKVEVMRSFIGIINTKILTTASSMQLSARLVVERKLTISKQVGRTQILILVTGSTGEIMPLAKIANILARTNLYDVIFCSCYDNNLKLENNVTWSHVAIDVLTMQQETIKLTSKPTTIDTITLGYHTSRALFQAAAGYSPKLVIANVITFQASAIAKQNKAKLMLTSAALELVGKMDTPYDEDPYMKLMSEGQLLKPLLAATLFVAYGVVDTEVPIVQADNKLTEILATFPAEWITWYGKKQKYNIIPFLHNIAPSDVAVEPGIYVLAGSTMGKSWEILMKLLLKHWSTKQLIIGISLQDNMELLLNVMSVKFIPSSWKVVQWINYNSIGNSTIITHGGAGVMADLTRNNNRYLIVPMIGDNFANAQWLSKEPFVISRKINELSITDLQQVQTLPMGKLEYEYLTKAQNDQIVLNTVHSALKNNMNCNCNRKHVLIHLIGTDGDLRSMLPAAMILTRGKHVTILTHDDLLVNCPNTWEKIALTRSSIDCAMVAAETMNINHMKPLKGLSNYRSMVVDSTVKLSTVFTKFDLVITNIFTPLSNVIGAMRNCKVIYIDAIPNRLFYVNDKEIATNLPISVSQAGNAMRFSILQSIDKNISGCDELNNETIEIVTCHRSMYSNYINLPKPGPKIYNMVSNKVVNDMEKSLTLTSLNLKVLVTFGSIPNKLILEIKDKIINLAEVHYSGRGNWKLIHAWANSHNYLNYPADLRQFDIVVHHGGVGTTWSCMQAGVYQIIMPIFGDQHIWAKYVTHEGIGEEATTVNDLVSAIKRRQTVDLKEQNDRINKLKILTKEYIDDTDDVLLLLNEKPLTAAIDKKYFMSKGNETPTIYTPGTYSVTVSNVLELFNPQTTSHCTLMCVQKGISLPSTDGLFDWKGPNLTELKALLQIHNINHMIINDDDIATLTVINLKRPLIQLKITQLRNSLHCVLISSNLTNLVPSPMLTIGLSQAIGDEVRESLQSQPNKSWDLVQNTNNIRETLMANLRLQTIDVIARLSRQSNPLKLIKLLSVTNKTGVWISIGSKVITNDSIYLSNDSVTDKPIILYGVQLTDRAILVTLTSEQPAVQTISVIRLSTNVTTKMTPTIKRSTGPIDWVFINNAAKKTSKEAKWRTKTVFNSEAKYYLIVNCVDNAQHDKFNNKFIINNAIKFELPKDQNIKEFKDVFMSERDIYFHDILFEHKGVKPMNELQISAMQEFKRTKSAVNLYNKWYLALSQYSVLARNFGVPSKKEVTWKELLDNYNQTKILESKFNLHDDTTFIYNESKTTTSRIIQTCLSRDAIVIDNNTVLLTAPLAIYTRSVKGGSYTSYSWRNVKDMITNTQDWWGLRSKTVTAINEAESTVNSEAMKFNLTTSDINATGETTMTGIGSGMHTERIEPANVTILSADLANIRMPNYETMVFWEDTDLTDWVSMYAPEESKLTSNEWAQGLIDSKKYTLTKYPEQSRPVHTKVAFEEHKSIAGRLFNVKRVRTNIPDANIVMARIFKAFFHDKARDMINQFKQEKLSFDTVASIKWMEEHKSTDKVYEDMLKLMGGDLLISPITDIKVHMKLESLLKEVDKVITRWEQQKARIIVWQKYAVAAIFSPIFTKAKKRLHKLFRNNVVYADGKTPEEMSTFMRGVDQRTRFVASNDLSQQDRQTDDALIRVEQQMYLELGIDQDVIDSWYAVHKDWRFKGTFTKGWRKSMRTTGQATTAIGNMITTLQCCCKFVCDNLEKVTFVVILGDDNSMGLTHYCDMRIVKRTIANDFNMISNPVQTEGWGEFCHFLIYKTSDGHWEIGPDYVRLRNRYEVTNGVSEITDDNMQMRAMSYMMTIGSTPEVTDLITKKNLPITPTMWYSQAGAVHAMMEKYNMSTEEVNQEYSWLIDMLTNNELHEKTLTVFTSKPRRF